MTDIFAPDPLISPADIEMAKDIFDVLTREYPDHPWGVNANVEGGIATVNLMYAEAGLITRPHGVVIHIRDLGSDPNGDVIKRAGGEMLERWGQARARATDESHQRARVHGLFKGRA